MDLKNLETTSTLAIEAVYRTYWDLIPEKYKLLEKSQRQLCGPVTPNEKPKPKKRKTHPLTYSEVEQLDKQPFAEDPQEQVIDTMDYSYYVDCLDKDEYFDMFPFFDPEDSFDNRVHYKIVGVNFPNRDYPWYVITWNCGQGLLNSSLTRRRFESAIITTPAGEQARFRFINTDLQLGLKIYSNDMQALFELQENIVVGQREKYVTYTRPHSVIGEFPVSVDTIGSQINKMERPKGTLCDLALSLTVDYPVIGSVDILGEFANGSAPGIIKEIHTEIDVPKGLGPDTHAVLSRDIILPDSEEVT